MLHDAKQRLPFSSNCSKSGTWNAYQQAGADPWKTWYYDLMPFMEMTDLFMKINPQLSISSTAVTGSYTVANLSVLNNQRMKNQECPSNPFARGCKTSTGGGFNDMSNSAVRCYAPCNGPQRCDGKLNDCATDNTFCSVAGSNWDDVQPQANPGMFSGRNAFKCDFASVRDGLSSTIMLSEMRGDLLTWGGIFSGNFQGCPTGMQINSPSTNFSNSGDYRNNMGAGSYHDDGAWFCLGDGSTRYLTSNTDFVLYNALGGRNDRISARLD